MKRKRMNDDYWPPRPGSWEEAVDPYEVQWSRVAAPVRRRDPEVVHSVVLSEPHQPVNAPMSV